MKREENADIFAACFRTWEGGKVLAHLEKFCHERQDLFNGENSRVTDYNLGRLSVLLEIKKLIEEGKENE